MSTKSSSAISTSYSNLKSLKKHPEIAASLGEMVVAWAEADAALSLVMAAVLDIKVNMAIVGYNRLPSFDSKIKFIQTIMTEWEDKDDHEDLRKTIDKIRRCSGARNRWMHGAWCQGNQKGEVVVFNLRAPEDRGRRTEIKAHDIEHHCETVRQHTRKLLRFVDARPK